MTTNSKILNFTLTDLSFPRFLTNHLQIWEIYSKWRTLLGMFNSLKFSPIILEINQFCIFYDVIIYYTWVESNINTKLFLIFAFSHVL